MVSERIQRRIDRLLDQAADALAAPVCDRAEPGQVLLSRVVADESVAGIMVYIN